ncbi:MAG: ATP-dependent sacrificial sulfur transferase LarE [Pirellulales bacterium]|nr:ATP-dependent sacrificial sulfur transferase LarE [Pirellulales bacterium]
MTSSAEPHIQLVQHIAKLPSCVVAFSGGVDSAVVTQAAHRALGDRAVAVTGISASLAAGELEIALRIAASIGIRHETVATDELSNAGYLRNQPGRCWHCKTELYSQLRQLGDRLGYEVLLNGANLDDQGDFRPGMQAAEQNDVRSPLIECGINKREVRRIAQHWNLEVWDKPATPCLSSRVVYGLEITPERLARIDAAEQVLRDLGIAHARVRYHHDDLARVEVPVADLPRLCQGDSRQLIIERFRDLGFRYLTLDLEGFRSGSFHQLIPADELAHYESASMRQDK